MGPLAGIRNTEARTRDPENVCDRNPDNVRHVERWVLSPILRGLMQRPQSGAARLLGPVERRLIRGRRASAGDRSHEARGLSWEVTRFLRVFYRAFRAFL